MSNCDLVLYMVGVWCVQMELKQQPGQKHCWMILARSNTTIVSTHGQSRSPKSAADRAIVDDVDSELDGDKMNERVRRAR